MPLKAVLFDLDNTLIIFEEPIFFKAYMKKISAHFTDLMPPHEFVQKLVHSTQMMIQNNGEKTNADFFIDSFSNGLNVPREKLWQRFINFYENEFEEFKSLMTPLPGVHDVLSNLKQKGLKIVIATNPMFPMIVQKVRLSWSGIDDIPFDLITSAENTTFCKPRLEYYHQICDLIDEQPQHCLMVGNDAFNDMIASKIGMKTFLTTDSDQVSIELSRELIKDTNLEKPTPDYKGSLIELIEVIDELI